MAAQESLAVDLFDCTDELLSIRLIPGCPETPPNIKTPAPKSSCYIRGGPLILGRKDYLSIYLSIIRIYIYIVYICKSNLNLCLHLYLFICIYIYMYVCMYVRMRICTCTCICMYLRTLTYVCMYVGRQAGVVVFYVLVCVGSH